MAHVNRTTIIQIYDRLKEVTEPAPGDQGLIRYKTSWSDTRVAGELIPDHPSGAQAVATIRAQQVGILRPARVKAAPPPPPEPIYAAADADRLERLEAAVARVEGAVRVIADRLKIGPLELGLGADLRDLKGRSLPHVL